MAAMADDQTAKPTRARRRLRILLWQLAALVVGLLAIEGGYRVYLRIRGEPFDSRAAHDELERLLSSARDFVPRVGANVPTNEVLGRGQGRVVHPYFAFDNVGGIEQLDAELTRVDKPEFESDYEVLIVGGSVADMFGHFGLPKLEALLAADPRLAGKRFYFYRYARGGFKEPQMVGVLSYLLGLGFTPEAVI